uniref:Alternative protein CASP8AP2 n=1 Tax=Homo sapiens TaxID=9606 RepID=L8EC81_HUMAN|nr:alternative protein CASP8AP2 [Homo sapiens]
MMTMVMEQVYLMSFLLLLLRTMMKAHWTYTLGWTVLFLTALPNPVYHQEIVWTYMKRS